MVSAPTGPVTRHLSLIDACGINATGPVTYLFEYPYLSVLDDVHTNFDEYVYNKFIHWQYEKEFRCIKVKAANAVIKFSAFVTLALQILFVALNSITLFLVMTFTALWHPTVW